MIVTYEDSTHTYKVDGEVVPSVTQTLASSGLCKLPDVAWNILERKRQIGRKVHAGSELIDKDNLNWDTVDPAILPYLKAYKRFLGDSRFVATLSEHTVVVQIGGKTCCGRLDRTGKIGKEPWIWDLKTACQVSPVYGVQMAGYELGLPRPMIPPFRYRRGALMLKPNGKYSIHEYTDMADHDIFRACMIYGAEHPAVKVWCANNKIELIPEEEVID